MDDNDIADPRARTFVVELRRFEQSTDPSALAELCAADATLIRLDARGERTGTDDRPVTYRGVTVPDFDADKIARLRT